MWEFSIYGVTKNVASMLRVPKMRTTCLKADILSNIQYLTCPHVSGAPIKTEPTSNDLQQEMLNNILYASMGALITHR